MSYIKEKQIIITNDCDYRYVLSLIDDFSIFVEYQEYTQAGKCQPMIWETKSSVSYDFDLIPILCPALLELASFYKDEKNWAL